MQNKTRKNFTIFISLLFVTSSLYTTPQYSDIRAYISKKAKAVKNHVIAHKNVYKKVAIGSLITAGVCVAAYTYTQLKAKNPTPIIEENETTTTLFTSTQPDEPTYTIETETTRESSISADPVYPDVFNEEKENLQPEVTRSVSSTPHSSQIFKKTETPFQKATVKFEKLKEQLPEKVAAAKEKTGAFIRNAHKNSKEHANAVGSWVKQQVEELQRRRQEYLNKQEDSNTTNKK